MDEITKYYGCKNSKDAIIKIICLTKDPNKWPIKFIAYFGDWYKGVHIFNNWNFKGHNSIVMLYMKLPDGKFVKTWAISSVPENRNKLFVWDQNNPEEENPKFCFNNFKISYS